jgi:homoserine kinase type II
MNSQTWLVEHEGSTYVAKRVRPAILPQLEAGCDVAAGLADAGFATGRPVPTRDGALVAAEAALALLEHVPGRELDGESDEEQRWIAETLAAVHVTAAAPCHPATGFYDWLSPDAPGVDAQPWLTSAIGAVRAETDPLTVTWSLLHTDPVPGAFRHDRATGVTGLIDWAGAQRGPVLYDVASAVMYLGGPEHATTFLETYAARGPLGADELRHLGAFRRFRWAVQGAYFAERLAFRDLTGVEDQADNERGLADARRGLGELGLDARAGNGGHPASPTGL